MEEITVLKGDLSRDEMHVVVYTLFSLFSSSVESKNEKKVKKKTFGAGLSDQKYFKMDIYYDCFFV
jgi:hypothetical protein